MNLNAYFERIRSSFPKVALDAPELIDEGMQFAVVIADGWVFRFARGEWGIASLANEARVLELLQPRISLAIPRYSHLEPDFCAYQLLRGEALSFQAWQRFEPATQSRLMHQLGEFMAQLHGTPITDHGIAPSAASRTREDWLRFYDELEEELVPKLLRVQRDWVRALFKPVLENRLSFEHAPTLIDGDISVYHVLYDPHSLDLSAKIDFGIAGVGDPAVDLACVLSSYGETGAKRVIEAYPALEAHLERARFWAGTLELQWVHSGLKRQPEELLWAHLGTARDLRMPGL